MLNVRVSSAGVTWAVSHSDLDILLDRRITEHGTAALGLGSGIGGSWSKNALHCIYILAEAVTAVTGKNKSFVIFTAKSLIITFNTCDSPEWILKPPPLIP